jgi:hypothetical protein
MTKGIYPHERGNDGKGQNDNPLCHSRENGNPKRVFTNKQKQYEKN